MKKIFSILLVVAMIACMSVSVFAAETTEFVKVASFDFSNTTGLKGFKANWVGDNKCNIAAAEVEEGVIVDGQFITGKMGFVVDHTIDASKGIKVTFDAKFDFNKKVGDPWWQGILTFLNADGKDAEVLAMTGEEFEHSFDAYYINYQGGGKNFQAHTGCLNDETKGNEVVWGGDPADLESGTKYAVEITILPATEEGKVDLTIKVDGEEVPLPNYGGEKMPEKFANLLSEKTILMIGGTAYGDYPYYLEMDNVNVYTMQTVQAGNNENPDAPQTGIATIALAVVAMLSGAYVVSKKH